MAERGLALAGGLGCAGLVLAAGGIWLWRFYNDVTATDPEPLRLAQALIALGCILFLAAVVLWGLPLTRSSRACACALMSAFHPIQDIRVASAFRPKTSIGWTVELACVHAPTIVRRPSKHSLSIARPISASMIANACS